jgi:hypothetical protein
VAEHIRRVESLGQLSLRLKGAAKILSKGKHPGFLILRGARVIDANLTGREVNLAPQQRQHLGIDPPARHVFELGDVP